MRPVHCAGILAFIGSLVSGSAAGAPEPFGSLAGGWMRGGVIVTKDGKEFVVPAPVMKDGQAITPEMRIFLDGNRWKLTVGGTPPTVYWNPVPTVYALEVPAGAKKGVLAIVVTNRGSANPVRFEYTLEKDTLTIRCKETVAAGPWLGDYDISGRWLRVRPGTGYFR